MKKVAIIQDLSSFGKCSLTAAIPVLSVMGVQAVPMPTAVFSAQSEYPSYFVEDFTSNMNNFTEEWKKLEVKFDGIFTGFVTGAEQINNIFRFLDTFNNKESLLLVDPVMGDEGQVYDVFTNGLLDYMQELVKQANVITPNVTECCLLAGLSYEKLKAYTTKEDYLKALEEAGNKLQISTSAKVIITGMIPPAGPNEKQLIGDMYIDRNQSYYHSMAFNGKSFSGTGDLFASVIMGSMMRGENLEKAVNLAVTFLSKAIDESVREGVPEIEGINFENHLGILL